MVFWGGGKRLPVSNTTDLAASTGSGIASGSGSSSFSYSASGSYSHMFDGGSASGALNASGSDGMSYGYTITASCSGGQWSKAGNAAVQESGSTDYSHTGNGSYAASGNGSASSSGSGGGSASGSGVPFEFQWSYSGSLSETASASDSYQGSTQFSLSSEGTWQATGGSGGSSGLGEMHQSFTGNGTYSYALGNGTISGTFGLMTSEHVAPYMFSTSATYTGGQWTETGAASATAAGQGNSNYTGTGTVGMAGEQWNASITVSENGTDSYLYLYTLGYVLDDQGAWILDTASGGIGGTGLANWFYSADGDYWYDVGQSTVTGDFSEFAEDHMSYSYTTTDTAAAGVWVHSGSGTWSDHGNGNRSFSAESPYTTADGYSGTVHETGYESFNYNYTGNPALDTQGNWSWSTGNGQASGNGHWTFNRSGSKPYSRTDGETYAVSGTRSENITDTLSYSYTTQATVDGQGNWAVTGGGTAQATGQATWTYSGSGSFSSNSSSPGSTSTYNATTSENGSSGSGYNFSLDFELLDDAWLPITGQGTVTNARAEHFSHTGTRQIDEQATWNNSGNGGSRSESRTLTQGQTKDLTYQRTDHYTWAPGSASASGSGSASGSAGSPWRLTQIEESGSATATRRASYDYSGSGSSWASWGDPFLGGTGEESWNSVRSIRQQSTATEHLSRTITWNDQGQELITGNDTRSASATGSADSFYHSQWEEHWWLDPESWASGGTWQNGTYDDYNYQYQWTKTWQGQGGPQVDCSAGNHVTGLENGSASGWWGYTDGEGNSSSTSWGGPWSDSYDETVNEPGFYAGAYYGLDYGGGEAEYFDYLGDAFSNYPGSDTGFFPFAYSELQVIRSPRADSAELDSAPYERGVREAICSLGAAPCLAIQGEDAVQLLAGPSQEHGSAAPSGPRYFPYPEPGPIGYQGIGYMGDSIKHGKIREANRVLDQMRDALEQTIRALSPPRAAQSASGIGNPHLDCYYRPVVPRTAARRQLQVGE